MSYKEERKHILANSEGRSRAINGVGRIADLETENARLREANQASLDKVSGLMVVLGLVKEAIANPMNWISPTEFATSSLDSILSTAQKPIAVVDGYCWNDIASETWSESGYLWVSETSIDSDGYGPVTVVIMPKGGGHE